MITSLYKSLQDWKLRTDGRQQLQHSYLAVTLGLVLAAGIIGLINYDLGQRILLGAFICIVVFVANAVAWALLQSCASTMYKNLTQNLTQNLPAKSNS